MRTRLLFASVLLLAACGDDPVYFGNLDASGVDTGGADTAGADAGVADAGGEDAGVTDAGASDAGAVDGAADGGATPGGELVDPGCLDGQYRESLPPRTADISAAVNGFVPGQTQAFLLEVLDARYPLGAELVRRGLQNTQIGDCIELFVQGADGSAAQLLSRVSTVVHECGHFADLAGGDFGSDYFIITEDIEFTCAQGDTTDRGGRTFARSLIMTDDYAALRPACDGGFGRGCDSYADIYLNGDAFDGTFDSGDQGFNALMEEAVQYVNSLASGYAFVDQIQGSVSERDGILTFLWYMQRYLAFARVEYPEAHRFLLNDACYRDLILTVWGRAWLYLEATEASRAQLGIDDVELAELVAAPELLAEIDAVREAAGCP